MSMHQRFKVWIFIFIVFSIQSPAAAIDIRVPGDYANLSEAIAAAQDSDAIIVSDCIYSGSMNKNIDLAGKMITVRSENGFAACILDCENDGRAFLCDSGESSQTVIEGFTIQNGQMTGDFPEGSGGGISCIGSSPIIRNCRFVNCITNDAPGYGGGVFCYENAAPTIENCIFEMNSAFNGAAIGMMDSEGLIIGCEFINNRAIEDGGALYIFNGSPLVDGCHFDENRCSRSGGAIYLANSATNIFSCHFAFNDAILEGGAIYCHMNAFPIIGGASIHGNVFSLNRAGVGADLFGESSYPEIDATYNVFSDCYESEYSVYHSSRFNLSFCQSEMECQAVDFYISPSGNDFNDGLSACAPFKTIRRALRTAIPSETNPLVIHLAPGIYSATETEEMFPLPLLPYLTISGADRDSTTIDAQGAAPLFIGYREEGIRIEKLTLKGFYDSGGFICERSFLQIMDCTWIDNPDSEAFAAIIFDGSAPSIERCRFQNHNVAIYANLSLLSVVNCEFEENEIGIHLMNCVDNDIRESNFVNNSDYGFTGFGSSLLMDRCLFYADRSPKAASAMCLANVFDPLPMINDCIFEGFTDSAFIGNIARIQMSHCQFVNNSGTCGGAIQFNSLNYPLTLFNCLFAFNQAQSGGAVYSHRSQARFYNCTFSENQAEKGGAFYCGYSGHLYFFNSILWGDRAETGSEIALGNDPYPSMLEIYYSDIQNGESGVFMMEGNQLTWGEGNIDGDPIFVNGISGAYYLSQIQSGQTIQSPCINNGSGLSIETCLDVLPGRSVCMSELTTRTDEIPDVGKLDMGYHLSLSVSEETPTPSPTAVLSQTPVITPTPDVCQELGVTLWMPSHFFAEGDVSACSVTVCNPTGLMIQGYPLFVILDVTGSYFFAPGFSSEADSYISEHPFFLPGDTSVTVLSAFSWPSGTGWMEGIFWYAALTDPNVTHILGDWDSWEFGWGS